MKSLKLFGCQDFYTGGKIVAIISTVENLVRAVTSLIFLLWACNKKKTHMLEREVNHAEVYVAVGIVGVCLSILLVYGITKRLYKLFLPWICFHLIIICYQVYFSCEVIKSGNFELTQLSSKILLAIFIFHTIFEAYYFCLIIGLSQIIANIKLIESLEKTNSKELQMRIIHELL